MLKCRILYVLLLSRSRARTKYYGYPTTMNEGEQVAVDVFSNHMHDNLDECLELRQGTAFVMCNGEGRDPVTLVASVDLDINVLSLRLGSSGELKHSLDISHIKVKRSYF